ncbi:MAG: hypothetical protein ACRDSP_09750 [Pseudonocardiaceae bacterium]
MGGVVSVEARVEWLALNRVGDGVLVQRDGGYFYAGFRVAGYLAQTCEELIGRGFLVLGRPSSGGHRRITDTGKVRYALLSDGQPTTGAGGGGW